MNLSDNPNQAFSHNRHFEQVFQESPFGIVLVGKDFRFFDVNPSFCTFTGYTKDELLKMTFREITHPSYIEIEIRAVRDALSSGRQVYKAEKKYVCKNGVVRWGSLTISNIRDDEGQMIHLLGIVEDITERKQAEAFHILTNERTQMLLNLYKKSATLTGNDIFDLALDYAVKMTQSKIGFLHQLKDDQQHIVLTTWNSEARKACTVQYHDHYPLAEAGHWADCVRERKPIINNDYPNSPYRKGLPTGHTPVKKFMSIPVFSNGKIRLIFGVGNKEEDYTQEDQMQLNLVADELTKIIDKRKSEEDIDRRRKTLRAILDASTEAVFMIEGDGMLIAANKVFSIQAGIDIKSIIGQNFFDIRPMEFSGLTKEIISVVISDHQPYRFQAQAGDLWIEFNLYPLIEHEVVTHVAVYANDVTAERMNQLELERINQELKDLNSTKDKFFSIIAHDLRGQFNALLGFSEILSDPDQELSPQQVKTVSGKLHSMLTVQFNLLQNLLDWAKIQRGKMQCNPEVINVSRIIDNINGLFAVQLIKKDLDFNNLVPDSLHIRADLNMLQSIFQNLISNAIKFTPRNGNIEINASRSENMAEITIKDSGIGISEENLTSIFKLDAVYSSKGTEGEKGSGLGIILVKEMTEKQGGWIRIRSVLHQGTTVSVFLPLA